MGGPGGTQAFTQWQNLPPYGLGQPGSVQGGTTPEPWFRDQMDAVRAMWRRTPDAQYPDGYLGTITNRRQDKLLGGMQGRLNEKNYQRGVHKGERIDTGDYYWPDEFGPNVQLRAQMRGVPYEDGVLTERFAPLGVVAPKITPERVFDTPGSGFTQQVQGSRFQAQMRKLAPAWRW